MIRGGETHLSGPLGHIKVSLVPDTHQRDEAALKRVASGLIPSRSQPRGKAVIGAIDPGMVVGEARPLRLESGDAFRVQVLGL